MGVAGGGQLIGRSAELEAVDRFVAAARAALASLIVDGEAGIGKSSLWQAALDRASAAGVRVLRSAPAESERGLTLGGLTDLLADVGDDELGRLPVPQRHALEIALLRAGPSGQLPDQRTLSVAAASLLRSVTAERPLLLAIDDAQWLDEASTAILAYAVRRLADRGAGVLMAVRGLPSPRVLELVAGVPDDARARLHVGPLPLAALHQLFIERFGRSFSRLVLVRIEQVSGGNPFYALEIARALAESPPVLTPGDRLPVPASLGSLLEARIAALPVPTRDALLLAAIAAEPSMATLRRAKVTAPAVIDPAVEAGIVTLDGGAIRFTHPLLAQAVIGATSAAELRRAHATLARTARSEDARARHLGGATEGRHENVAAALESAAAVARDRGATIDAASLYERASELTPGHRPEDSLRRATLAADCLLVDLSEAVQADVLLERAIRDAPPGPLRAEALSLRALTRYYHGDLPTAVELADRAVADSGAGTAVADEARRAVVLGRASFVVMQVDLRRGLELARYGLRVAASVPDVDPDVLANLLLLDATGTFGLVEGVRQDEIERGRALVTATGRSWEHDGVAGIDFGLARQTDDLDRAIAMTHELIGRKAGPGGIDPFNLVMLSELQLRRGDVAAARASAEAADKGYAREGADVFPAWRLRGLALVAAYEGRHDDATRLARDGLDLARQSGDPVLQLYHQHILGFVALASGDHRAADDHLTAAAELAGSVGTLHPARFKLDGDRLEAALAIGDSERAVGIIASLARVNAVAPTPWTRVVEARGRGLLAASAGELDDALGHLTEALLAGDALPVPFERGRTLIALGQVRRRRKEKRLADEALREALALFEEIGSPAWAARARAELGRIGLRPTAPAHLTETERRVATLAASGLSSREIGEIAFLAPKTVGNVLGRVYEKLGIHSRAELGARLGTVGPSATAFGPDGTAGDRSG